MSLSTQLPLRWYLVAYDLEKRAWRTLRLDRVVRVVKLRELFAARNIPDHAVRRFALRNTAVAPYPYTARVRIRATADVTAKRLDAAAVNISDGGDGTCVLEAVGRFRSDSR
ncbi:WYL domain-containing protein [Leucobacter sp. BZR 635]